MFEEAWNYSESEEMEICNQQGSKQGKEFRSAENN
jgi:hypothetical protein